MEIYFFSGALKIGVRDVRSLLSATAEIYHRPLGDVNEPSR
jgi:hypothetical protein